MPRKRSEEAQVAARALGLLPIDHHAIQHCDQAAAAAADEESSKDRWWCTRCESILRRAAYHKHLNSHMEHLSKEGEEAYWLNLDGKFGMLHCL